MIMMVMMMMMMIMIIAVVSVATTVAIIIVNISVDIFAGAIINIAAFLITTIPVVTIITVCASHGIGATPTNPVLTP